MGLMPVTDGYLAISKSAENAMLLGGIEDTYHNRVVFYTGLLHAWKSEPIQDRQQQSYNRLLQKMIDEAKELHEFSNQIPIGK